MTDTPAPTLQDYLRGCPLYDRGGEESDLPEQAATALDAAQARIAKLEAALDPFAFYDEDNPKADLQSAWEMRYRDRFQDWIDCDDIATARAALEDRT